MLVRTLLRNLALLVAAWLPFFSLWVFFAAAYGHQSVGAASYLAFYTIGSAAFLGLGVWYYCAAYRWPQEVRIGFYARHLAMASLYSALWILATYWIGSLRFHESLWHSIVTSQILGWQFVMGVWLYGLVAGVTYAMQTREWATRAEIRAARAEAALHEARLEALRNRLHPHFLFNALHTVAALVREDATRAENAVDKLGELLRYTLSEERDVVPLREEWELTRRYLEFEQLRYEELLRVKAEIQLESLACAVPSFAVQTLVENAVRHSIATRTTGGHVEVSAIVSDGRLRVIVRDDGSGAGGDAGMRSGLRTLRERLAAVHGNDAQVTSRTAAGEYEAGFSIPCARAAEPVDD
ncbi:MAG: histidine kinase [Acidobacteria bacterium]|nr:histidine kinase [Acidobacteriota bacterium]MBV9479093.1 histidine kinase [Acidobacteriota bacterium]